MVDAFRKHGGADKPAYLQAHVALAPTVAQARENAHREWRSSAIDPPLRWDAQTPEHLDIAARFVRPDDMDASVRIASRFEDLLGAVREDGELGFSRVYLHEVSRDQASLLRALGTHHGRR